MRILTILFLTVLCLSFTSSFSKDKSRRWIIEIKDRCKTEFSTQILATIATDLDGKAYVFTQSGKILLQEIASFKGEKREKDFPVHHFILPTEHMHIQVGDGKVSLYFNSPNSDGIYNADFLLFLSQKNGIWERVLNPGNFRFEKIRFKKIPTTDELQERIKEDLKALIVVLTFK